MGRERGITPTAVTTIKMEELIEMVQLVEEEENKEKKKEDNTGSFQWQDTLIRKVLCITDTLVFSLAKHLGEIFKCMDIWIGIRSCSQMITNQLVSFPDYILSQNMDMEDCLFHFGRHSTDPAFDRL